MFSEIETMKMEDKPRFLTEKEKKLRTKCIKRERYLNNKEKYKIHNKKYREGHKEEIKLKYQENKEENKEQKKEYYKTPQGYKVIKKFSWKQQGLNMTDFEEIFKRYCETTNCDNCNCILTKDKINTSTTKCMDHCHITGTFRNILCIACNVRRK